MLDLQLHAGGRGAPGFRLGSIRPVPALNLSSRSLRVVPGRSPSSCHCHVLLIWLGQGPWQLAQLPPPAPHRFLTCGAIPP